MLLALEFQLVRLGDVVVQLVSGQASVGHSLMAHHSLLSFDALVFQDEEMIHSAACVAVHLRSKVVISSSPLAAG